MEPRQILKNLLLLADDPATARLSGEELSGWPTQFRKVALSSGFLRECAPARIAPCDQCDNDSFQDVVLLTQDKTSRAYLVCNQCGRVEVPLKRLKQYSIHPEGFGSWVAAQLGIRTAPDEQAPGRLWRLGACELGKERLSVLLVRGLHWPDAHQVLAPTLSQFEGLCLSLHPTLTPPEWLESGPVLSPLASCVRVFKGHLALNKVDLRQLAQNHRKSRAIAATQATRKPRKRIIPQAIGALVWSDGFRTVSHGKHVWSLTTNQACVVERLIEALGHRTPALGQSALLEELGISSTRLRDVFKKSSAWNTLVVRGERRGTYRINPRFSQ